MKKIIAILLSILLTFSLAGCGGMSMEEYVEENKSIFDTICEQQSNETCEIEILGKDNSLIFKATMKIEIDESVKDAVVASLQTSTEQNKEVYTNMLENARKEVSDAESIIVEYYDKNDNLLYSKEFK